MSRVAHAHRARRSRLLDALRVLGSGAAFLFVIAVVFLAMWLTAP